MHKLVPEGREGTSHWMSSEKHFRPRELWVQRLWGRKGLDVSLDQRGEQCDWSQRGEVRYRKSLKSHEGETTRTCRPSPRAREDFRPGTQEWIFIWTPEASVRTRINSEQQPYCSTHLELLLLARCWCESGDGCRRVPGHRRALEKSWLEICKCCARETSSSGATTWTSRLLKSSSCLSACLKTPCSRSQPRRQLCSTEWELVSHFFCFSFLRKGSASLRVN